MDYAAAKADIEAGNNRRVMDGCIWNGATNRGVVRWLFGRVAVCNQGRQGVRQWFVANDTIAPNNPARMLCTPRGATRYFATPETAAKAAIKALDAQQAPFAD